MNILELELIEKWQADPSFTNWVNQINDVDIAKWESYFIAHPQHLELTELAKFPIQHFDAQIKMTSKQKSQEALTKLRTKIESESISKKSNIIPFRISSTWRIVASFLIVAGVGLWTYTSSGIVNQEIVWTTLEEQKDILLEDGTEVILNKNSRLSYVDSDVRNVQLDGEAFFNVTKKPIDNEAFTVTTKDLVVQVLGTQFNVNTEDQKTSVYLDEGKVNLNLGENQSPPIQMEPGYLVSYAKTLNKVIENRKADALENIAWKDKVILFEETSLQEVLLVVSKVYD
ncbi:MAG: transmembrane sensor, partial [Saprospiraceae bacterium]